jgi:hypothetical protein
MRSRWIGLWGLLSASVVLLFAAVSPVSGEETMREKMIKARADAMALGAPGQKGTRPEYGTTDGTTVNVYSYAFQGMDPYLDQISDDGNAFRYFRAAGSGFLIAPVNVPSGVVIDYVEFSNCINTAGDLFLALWDATYGQGSVAGTLVDTVSTAAGCGVDGTYNINYLVPSNYGNPLTLFLLWSATYDGTTKFNDVTIGYHRVVSPAPGSPSFLDVPLSDPAFQWIEALVASGITVGCGDGTIYCPDNPVTRRQMAVFLAKGFGLHWPD